MVIGMVATAVLLPLAAVGFLLLTDDTGISGFEPANGQLLFPELSARSGEVSRIEIDGPYSALTLTKSGDGWQLLERDGFRARREAVEALIDDLAGLSAVYVSREELAHTDYGVADPEEAGNSVRVRLLDEAGEPIAGTVIGHTFSVPGEQAESNVFVRRDGGARVWLAAGAPEVPTLPSGWIDREVVDIPPDTVIQFTTAPASGKRVTIRRTGDDDLTASEAEKDETGTTGWALDTVVSVLEGLELEDVRARDSLPDDIVRTGTSAAVTSDGLEYRIELLSDGPTVWAVFSAEPVAGADDGAAGRAERFNDHHSDWAYQLPRLAVTRLMTAADDIEELTTSAVPAEPAATDAATGSGE